MNISGWKIAKYLLYAFLALLFLFMILLLLTQTGLFRGWLKGYIEDQASMYVNGRLEIGELNGNLFSRINFEDISIISDSITVVSIDNLAFGYDLLGMLSSEIRIDSILIDSPDLLLVQNEDGTWNLQNVFMTGEKQEPADTGGEFGYGVFLDRFHLRNGIITVHSSDSLIPRQVTALNILLSALYREPEYRVNLDSLNFRTLSPKFVLENTELDLSGNDKQIALNKLEIRTSLNRFNATGIFHYEENKDSEFDLKTDSLYFEEFTPFLEGLPDDMHPILQTNINLARDSLNFDFGLDGRGYKIETVGYLKGLVKYMEDSTASLSYELDNHVENINFVEFFNDTTMQSSITGNFSIYGSGISPEDAVVNLRADFDQSTIMDNRINRFSADLDYNRGDASGSIGLGTDYGNSEFNFIGRRLLATPEITADGSINNINLSGFLPEELATDINLAFSASVKGSDPDSISADILLNVRQSTYGQVLVDTARAELHVSPGVYRVDTLFAGSGDVTLSASGEINDQKEGQVDYILNVGDLGFINKFTDSLDIGGILKITGAASGNIDSLLITAKMEGRDIFYETYTIAELTGDNKIKLYPELLEVSGKTAVQNILISNALQGSSQIEYTASTDTADIIFEANMGDTVKIHLESSLKFDSLLKIHLSDLVLDLKEERWHSAYDLTNIVYDENSVILDSLLLLSDGDSPSQKQRIRLAGNYSFEGPMRLNFSARNIDLAKISGFAALPDKISGLLDYSLALEGTAASPDINSRLDISGIELNDVAINKLTGEVTYHDTLGLGVDIEIIPSDIDSFKVSGHLPVEMNMAEGTYSIDKDAPFEIDIVSNEFPLRALSRMSQVIAELDGSISTEIHASNTLNNPSIRGYLSLTGNSLKIPEYGIEFSKFGSFMRFEENKGILDSLTFRRDKGYLKLTGELNFGGGILEGNIHSTQFDLKAHDIFLARHRHYQIQIAGDAGLNSSESSAKYSGGITILRSNFYLPALMDEYGGDASYEPRTRPMLVTAAGWDSVSTAETSAAESDIPDSTYQVFDNFMNRLQGRLKISIPRNTWIRSPEMRMEISGDIDIVKESADFELFGSLSIVRGHYELYGKRFIIKEGTLTFQGGSEMDPNISLEANYTFRTVEREKKTLTLNVSGTSLSPQLSFSLDDQAISEGDAASYIVFGRSLDQLTFGQRSGLTGGGGSGNGSFAKGMAASLLSDQLAKALGNELALDVIEINARDDWQSASFVVGKYITNDLFVSYQRDIGEVRNDDITPETVTLEYELTKRIFLQLIEGDSKESGFDIFFKFRVE